MNSIIASHSIDQLVAFQAASKPDAIALAYGARYLTYNELDERAAALAHVLRSFGVKPETVVGVCMQRSPAMVIAALAVWKAGGAYLPLDALNPAARLAFMAKDAQISVLVAGEGNEDKAPKGEWPTIVLDAEGKILEGANPTESTAALPEAGLDRLAYVIYTSGSTGEPNGVEVTQENLLSLVSWHQQAFQVTSDDRASQIANFGFDAAGWEIWPYLATGASVYIAGPQLAGDAVALRDWLVAERITISFAPTPLAELLLTLPWPRQTALRYLLTGADTLHRYPPEGVPFQLINNYGPTECTVVATSGRVLPGDAKDGLPTIGWPISSAQIYILDDAGQPVAGGTEGELYIGGACVARGYRNRPELTAKRFVADSTSPTGGRMFKTGDAAKFLPDGQIAFAGRKDDQIKVRGFRIEPNEIAAALNRHPQVVQSLVVGVQAGAGEKRLVAYIVPARDGTPTPSELRDFLRVRLPDYMIPDIFVKLDSLPLSANGKPSRSQLPLPNEENTLQDHAFTAPRTELEKTVADILGSLLGLPRVDVEENFFAMGAHSLVGAQLIARLRRICGLEMSLRTLFAGPTVAELAAEIERLQQSPKRAQPKDHECLQVACLPG